MIQTETAGRTLARTVARLTPEAMRGFVTELSKSRRTVLEDLADVIVSLKRRREPRRNYRAFWAELHKSRNP